MGQPLLTDPIDVGPVDSPDDDAGNDCDIGSREAIEEVPTAEMQRRNRLGVHWEGTGTTAWTWCYD